MSPILPNVRRNINENKYWIIKEKEKNHKRINYLGVYLKNDLQVYIQHSKSTKLQ